MKYARGLQNVTVHLSDHENPRGPALCGHTPRWDSWNGLNSWCFFETLPAAPVPYSNNPDETYLCKGCQKAAKKLEALAVAS